MTGTVAKSIVHMDLDTFFVSVERLQNSALNGKPVLIGGKSDRGVVASCSYEARKYGVSSAMPMRMALQLCPEAIIVRGDSERYSYYSNIITDVIQEEVPLYEKTSIDEFYIDLTGMDRFFGCYTIASDLRNRIIKESGLPISFGLSANKTVSKVATGEAKPLGQAEVIRGTEKAFLAPLTVNKIPMVGKKTTRDLRRMGIKYVRTLQEVPMPLLQKAFGKSGEVMWKKANGIDNSPVIAYTERKSISTERTFNQDTIDVTKLQAILVSMTEKLCHQLRTEEKLTACVTVKIRYSDFETHTRQFRIPYTACDHTLIDRVKTLFYKLYQRRVLVRLIGVRFSHLVRGGYQINLLEDTEEILNLYQAMDRMNSQFGKGTVKRAVSLGVRHRDFNPFNGKGS